MALVNDPTFLIYQLRVSFLRANDPTGERVLTFSDLTMPPMDSVATRARQGSGTPSPMSPAGRRNTSASELRQQIAQNTEANAYIMACGHYPETETVGSPEIYHNEGLMYSRPTPRMAHPGSGVRGQDGGAAPPPSARYPGGTGAAGRTKRTNRSAKIAPTGEGREEVVGLGVVPQHPDMLLNEYGRGDVQAAVYVDGKEPPPTSRRSLDTVRPRPLAVVEEITDLGSLSDSAQTQGSSDQRWPPKNMPPRRSLDTIQRPEGTLATQGSASTATRADRMRYQGHAPSNSLATIRIQRPADLLRKGSSRDAMALGTDFDVKTMFESADGAGAAFYEGAYYTAPAVTSPELKARQRHPESAKTSTDSACSQDHTLVQSQADSAHLSKQQGPEGASQSPSRGAGSIALRAKRSDASSRGPLTGLREDGGPSSSALKRSVTLPTKRPSAHHHNQGYAAGQKSKWVGGAYVDARRQQGSNQASGWVGGAEQTSWDRSSDEETDFTPLSRRGASTQTWYGPQAGIRPISMFPPFGANGAYQIPPVPLLFGADDSDDDIDLEGDDGSSRTPALLGLGFGRGLVRPHPASPNPSERSRSNSISMLSMNKRRGSHLFSKVALATSVPVSSPLSATPVASAVAGAKYEHLALETGGSRPRGISDPQGRQSARGSKIEPLLVATLSPGARAGASGGSHESHRAIDGSAPIVSARTLEWSFKGASAAIASKLQPSGLHGLTAMSVYEPPPAPQKSGLSALLSSKIEIQHNPFSEEFGAIGGTASDRSLLALKMFVIYGSSRQSQLINARVRRAATVEQTIGNALYRYIDEGLEPALEASVQDVVMWTLRIAEDGEVDDDFPALDRTRPVASFGCDEFALCLSTPEQVKLNEEIRARQGRPPRMARPKSLLPKSPLAATTPTVAPSGDTKRELRYKITHRVETSTVVLQPSRMAIASTARIFVGTGARSQLAGQLSMSFGKPPNKFLTATSPAAHAPCELRLFKIRVLGEPKSAEALQTTTVETDSNATIDMVLSLVCRKKPFTEDQYALGVVDHDRFIACSSDMRVSQVPLGVELCLQKISSPSLALDRLGDARQTTSAFPVYGQYQWPPEVGADALAMSAEAAAAAARMEAVVDGSGTEPSSVYYTFRVIRRAQMFARHERLLVIDGDVVTLMPSDHRIESAKTLTFHISNIECKRNQKSPKKIRLFISRRGSSGEKSVDLEAMSEEDAVRICNILLQLRDQYVTNGA